MRGGESESESKRERVKACRVRRAGPAVLITLLELITLLLRVINYSLLLREGPAVRVYRVINIVLCCQSI